MSLHRGFVPVLLALWLLMLAPLGLAVWLLWLTSDAAGRAAMLDLVHGQFPVVVFAIALLLAAAGSAARALYRYFVLRAFALGEQIRTMSDCERGVRVPEEGPASLRRIAWAANRLAGQRDALRSDIGAQIACARQSVEIERNRLAALVSELSQSVVVCNLDGRILLYNSRAREQFRALSDAPEVADGGELIGLGRSIYASLDRAVIAHALEVVRLRVTRGCVPATTTFVTTCGGGRLLRVQLSTVRPIGGDATPSGFILLLDDITAESERDAQREERLDALVDALRGSLGRARELVAAESHTPADLAVLRSTIGEMAAGVNVFAAELAERARGRWPLETLSGEDLAEVARRRICSATGLEVLIESVDDSVWLMVDSFSLLQALVFLAHRARDEFEVTLVSLRVGRGDGFGEVDLVWHGHVASEESVASWAIEPITAAGHRSPLTVRDVLERHRGGIRWMRERLPSSTGVRLMLPLAEDDTSIDPPGVTDARLEYYDFDIFNWSERSRALNDHALVELSYTAFDTETTGLEPSAGDEIIQIGATRIVNGKLLRAESFEQLVDPQRSLRPESVAVHGIRPEMLVGQPTVDKVLPAFHAFVADTVLVAHNAAFDMRFLQLKEAATGLVFDQPVLDTLLLSALLHPNQESHTLEAIAGRLGVTVKDRHTALGDALVTAEVFIRMLPMLAERGIHTLGEAREACAQTYFARVSY